MKKKYIREKNIITGLGMITPAGFGVPSFQQILAEGLSTIRCINETHPEESKIISVAGLFNNNSLIELIELIDCGPMMKQRYLKLASHAPLTVQATLLVALEAYLQAKLFKLTDTERMGIIVTGNNTTQKLAYAQQQIYLEKPEYVSSRYAVNFLDSSHIGYLSELFDIRGEGHVVGAASASGTMALIQANRLLDLGVIDQCMIVGVLAELSVIELQALRNLSALGGVKYANQPEKASRPFDKYHEGFIPGQLSGCVILERAESAMSRNAPILGHILGSGIALDANYASNPKSDGEALAMLKAMHDAQMGAEHIDYINTHGTSSISGDEAEVEALLKVFGGTLSKKYANSTKSLLGHGLWSAGIVEAIATLVQMNAGFIHKNRNLYEPITDQVNFIKDIEWVENKIGMSNSFAFGGINTSIILSKG